MAGYNLGQAVGQIVIGYNPSGVAAAQRSVNSLTRTQAAAATSSATLGKGLLGVGAVMVGAFGAAVATATNFEKRMSAIKAVTGATAPEMSKLSAEALRIGKDTVFSASQAAQAIEELAKAGISIPDIMNGAADATVALAAAGEIDLPEAATIASNAMNQFALSAKVLPKVADDIAGAANASAIDVSEFGQSMQQVGAVAHLNGFTFHDTAVAIAELGNAGIRGSDAGTSLKTMFQNLQPQTKRAADEMQRLGLITADGTNRFIDQNGKMKSLRDISQILQGSLKGMTAAQKSAALQIIFGTDAIRASAILTEQGAAGYDKMSTAMGKVTAADVAKTRMDNLSGSIEQLKGSLETAAITVGEFGIGPIRNLANGITTLVNSFLNLPDPIKHVLANVLLFGGGAALLLGVLLRMGAFIAGPLGAAFAAIFSPIGLLVAAVVALGVGLVVAYNRSATFRAAIQNVGRALAGLVAPVVAFGKALADTFGPLIVPIVRALAGVLVGSLLGALHLLAPVINALAAGFRTAASVLENNKTLFQTLAVVVGTFTAVLAVQRALILAYNAAVKLMAIGILLWRTAMASARIAMLALSLAMDANPIGLLIAAIAALVIGFIFLVTHVKGLRDALEATGRFIAGTAVAAFHGFLKAVQAVWNWIKSNWPYLSVILIGPIGLLVGYVATHLTQVKKLFIDGFHAIVSGIQTALSTMLQAFITWAPKVLEFWALLPFRILALLIGLTVGLAILAVKCMIALLNGFISALPGIINFFVTLPGRILGWLESLVGLLVSLAFRAFLAWLNAYTTALGAIASFFIALPGRIFGWLVGLIGLLGSLARSAMSSFYNGLLSFLGAVVGFFSSLPGRAYGAASSLIGRLASLGSSAMSSLYSGITGGFGAVQSFMAGLPGRIMGAIGDLGSLLYNAGLALIGGLFRGVVDKAEDLYHFASGIAGKIASLKGPIEYDRVLLEPQGQAIIEGLINGMAGALPGLYDLASNIAPSVQMHVAGGDGAAAPVSPAAVGAGNLTLQFNFGDVSGGEATVDAITSAVSSPDVLAPIIRAARQGVRPG